MDRREFLRPPAINAIGSIDHGIRPIESREIVKVLTGTVIPAGDGDYHSDFWHVSRSALALFAQSRRAYKRKYIDGKPFDDSDCAAFRIGTGTHAVALRDAIELQRICLIPENVLGKGGRRSGRKFDTFRLKNRGKTLLLKADFELCLQLAQAIESIEIAENEFGEPITIGNLIHSPNALREFEYRWFDVLPCRIKCDLVIRTPAETLCFDLKTARSIDERAFRSEIQHRRLWLQDAHYRAGLMAAFGKPVRFIFLPVEKTFPHDTDVFELDPDDAIQAARARGVLLERLAGCMETGEFEDPVRSEIKRIKLSPSAFDLGE